MGRAMNLEPLLSFSLVFTNFVANFRMEYLGATTRQATESNIKEFLENILDRPLG